MKKPPLERQQVLALLKHYKKQFERDYGVTALGVFGSVARQQATADSDVDIVVRMREPDLFFTVHIRETLEEALGSHVDIIHYRERMNSFLKKRIDRDAVYA
jgi:uncharacterized protein